MHIWCTFTGEGKGLGFLWGPFGGGGGRGELAGDSHTLKQCFKGFLGHHIPGHGSLEGTLSVAQPARLLVREVVWLATRGRRYDQLKRIGHM